LAPTDLESFVALRSRPETQNHSTLRGRPDRDAAESKMWLDRYSIEPTDGDGHGIPPHWYFGAFLQSTGEMIGEGGFPDLVDQASSKTYCSYKKLEYTYEAILAR
jgi:hypothetical protein